MWCFTTLDELPKRVFMAPHFRRWKCHSPSCGIVCIRYLIGDAGPSLFNSLRPRLNRPHFADDIIKCILLNENALISIKVSLNFIPKGPINNIPALVQIMAWRRPGDKPLSEPMVVSLLTHICATRPPCTFYCRFVTMDKPSANLQHHENSFGEPELAKCIDTPTCRSSLWG